MTDLKEKVFGMIKKTVPDVLTYVSFPSQERVVDAIKDAVPNILVFAAFPPLTVRDIMIGLRMPGEKIKSFIAALFFLIIAYPMLMFFAFSAQVSMVPMALSHSSMNACGRKKNPDEGSFTYRTIAGRMTRLCDN